MVRTEIEARAHELQREYMREWRKKNQQKIRDYNRNYWERKARAEQETRDTDVSEKNRS